VDASFGAEGKNVSDLGPTSRSAGARAVWLSELRRENERQEDAADIESEPYWKEIDDVHRTFVERFLSMLPPGGSVLDAACGIGRYIGMILGSGRSATAVDASGSYLAVVGESSPDATIEKHDLQELPYRDRFDGVMCVDAMEFVPREDWSRVLTRFRDALHPEGWLYLTVELVPAEQIRSSNEAARRAGLPVVDGEVMWEMRDRSPGYYHFYPSLEQVREWMTAAGFRIVDEIEGPWVDGEYAYQHVLARTSGEVEPR
jgi:cyclopropane fatty-acyl-phospholipid synthase-like methyltransferase